MSYQKVIIEGAVGRDCDLKYTPAGIAVAEFSVATTKVTGKGESKREKTVWWKVTLWRERAENLAQYIKKGNRILVEGEADIEVWTDKDGKPAGRIVITASQVDFLTPKNQEGNASTPYDNDEFDDSSNIPF